MDRKGGQVAFDVPADERVYFWWRGPAEPAGLEILGPAARRSRTTRRIA